MYIGDNGIGGSRFTPAEIMDLNVIRNDRNTYLHQANCFPADGVIRQFLSRTVRVLGSALRFPP